MCIHAGRGAAQTIIRYVMPCDNHEIKKLLLIFWEIVPKYGGDGKLLHEMILVCDAYRKDLVSPNEYIRGSTLRFLCKLKEPELLEPLMPSIQENLSNRHAYVGCRLTPVARGMYVCGADEPCAAGRICS